MAVSNGEAKRDKAAASPGRGRSALDRQLRKAMDANLQELELMHKRVNTRVNVLFYMGCCCIITLTQHRFQIIQRL